MLKRSPAISGCVTGVCVCGVCMPHKNLKIIKFKSNFVFVLGCLCKCMQNKLRLAAILLLCRTNLPRIDARIWPHFQVKTHKSPLFNTHIGMSTALFIAVTNKIIAFLVDINQRKAIGIIFNSDNISRQQNQVIESFIH